MSNRFRFAVNPSKLTSEYESLILQAFLLRREGVPQARAFLSHRSIPWKPDALSEHLSVSRLYCPNVSGRRPPKRTGAVHKSCKPLSRPNERSVSSGERHQCIGTFEGCFCEKSRPHDRCELRRSFHPLADGRIHNILRILAGKGFLSRRQLKIRKCATTQNATDTCDRTIVQ